MNKLLAIATIALCSASLEANATPGNLQSAVQKPQLQDTSTIRKDTLKESVLNVSQDGSYISRLKARKTEVTSKAGIRKLACCTLAESFENSAAVSVGYADAVTGAKQIRLLGLSGIYTQMLDENRPIMRGLESAYGLSFIPGEWMESIQVAKGPGSVINGSEGLTGIINVEHRKPTDPIPLFLQVNGSSHTDLEANAASSFQFGNHWYTEILGHYSQRFMAMDMNKDGFADEPLAQQYSLANRWLFSADNGIQVRFGVSALYDARQGGQISGLKEGSGWNTETLHPNYWNSNVRNKLFDAYVKAGFPFDEENKRNLAIVTDFSHYDTYNLLGQREFTGGQNNLLMNILFQDEVNEYHKFTAGLNAKSDNVAQDVTPPYAFFSDDNGTLGSGTPIFDIRESSAGAFGEYTFTYKEKFSAIAGLHADWSTRYGFLLCPRFNAKYSFTDDIIVRASAGRGYRTSYMLSDNLGVLSTGRSLFFAHQPNTFDIEDAWTYGGNVTIYLPLGNGKESYFGLDYFHTDFIRQLYADQEYNSKIIYFYMLSKAKHPSYANTFQADLNIAIVKGLSASLSARYVKSMIGHPTLGLIERPMTSRFKGVFNVRYATPMDKWVFDFTAQLNGKMRVYKFMKDDSQIKNGYSPVYPVFYAQVTHKFKGFEAYIGGENIGDYRQKSVIINADSPFTNGFNASCVWGPITGIMAYAGIRIEIFRYD
jgi:outer membrane receptor for ferrienterochelin and colicins